MRRTAISIPLFLWTLAWPATAYASDMAILAFFVSFPVCLALVALTFVLAAVVPPNAGAVLLAPIAALAGIHLYLLPNMVHADELIALAIQGAVSATSLLAFRSLRRRDGD